jgi:predicted phage tail protein
MPLTLASLWDSTPQARATLACLRASRHHMCPRVPYVQGPALECDPAGVLPTVLVSAAAVAAATSFAADSGAAEVSDGTRSALVRAGRSATPGRAAQRLEPGQARDMSDA